MDVSFIHSWHGSVRLASHVFPPARSVWIRKGCVQVDGLAQLPASEPSELLQILRKGLAQPPGPSHLGVGEELPMGVCVFFFGGDMDLISHLSRCDD